jgi:hypothetical protein
MMKWPTKLSRSARGYDLLRWIVPHLFPVIGMSTFVVTNKTIPMSSTVTRTRKQVTFRAMCFSGVDCCWGVSAQGVDTLWYLLQVLWISATFVPAKVIAFKLQIELTTMQSERKYMGQCKRSLEAHTTVPIMVDVSKPDPTWPEFGAFRWYRAVLVDVVPKIFNHCQVSGRWLLDVYQLGHTSLYALCNSIVNRSLQRLNRSAYA